MDLVKRKNLHLTQPHMTGRTRDHPGPRLVHHRSSIMEALFFNVSESLLTCNRANMLKYTIGLKWLPRGCLARLQGWSAHAKSLRELDAMRIARRCVGTKAHNIADTNP